MTEPTFPWFDPTTPASGSLVRGLHFRDQFKAGVMDAEVALSGLASEVTAHLRNLSIRDAGVTAPGEGQQRADARGTSAKAAAAVTLKAGSQRFAVLAFLVEHGPATDHQIQDALRLGASSERPRRLELLAGGWAADSGKTAIYRLHLASVLWCATAEGHAAYTRLKARAAA